MNVDEKISRSVENSIQDYSGDLTKAVKCGEAMVGGNDERENSDTFYKAASAIVEPLNVPDTYYEWMENKPDSWSGFISSTFGANWGQIAKIVNDFGY
jgi:hypothetical protein